MPRCIGLVPAGRSGTISTFAPFTGAPSLSRTSAMIVAAFEVTTNVISRAP